MRGVGKNIKYMHTLDGSYNSYYIGKFIACFVKRGKKIKASKQIMTALLSLKLLYNTHPAVHLFEILEQARPIFQLKNCFPRKTKIVYPTIVIQSRRYIIALH